MPLDSKDALWRRPSSYAPLAPRSAAQDKIAAFRVEKQHPAGINVLALDEGGLLLSSSG